MSLRRFSLAITLLATLAACSGSPAGSSPSAGTPALGATGTPPAVTVPTATAAGTAQQPCPGPGDPVLTARLPAKVGDVGVAWFPTDWLVCYMANQRLTTAQIDSVRQGLTPIGIDLDTVSFSEGLWIVGGSTKGLEAYRFPGQDANKLIQNSALLGLSAVNPGDTVAQETIGDKSVSVFRSAAGVASLWMCARGDTLWTTHISDGALAAAVFAAIP